jgi:hypothetical protein
LSFDVRATSHVAFTVPARARGTLEIGCARPGRATVRIRFGVPPASLHDCTGTELGLRSAEMVILRNTFIAVLSCAVLLGGGSAGAQTVRGVVVDEAQRP